MIGGVPHGLRGLRFLVGDNGAGQRDWASGRLRPSHSRGLLAGGLGLALACGVWLHAPLSAWAVPEVNAGWDSYLVPSFEFAPGEWDAHTSGASIQSGASIPVNDQAAWQGTALGVGGLGAAYRSPSATESVVFGGQMRARSALDILGGGSWAAPDYPHWLGVAGGPSMTLNNADLGVITVKPSSTSPANFDLVNAGVQSPATLTNGWVGAAVPGPLVISSSATALRWESTVSWLAVAQRRPDGLWNWSEAAFITVDGGHKGRLLMRRTQSGITLAKIDGGYRAWGASPAASQWVRAGSTAGVLYGDTVTSAMFVADQMLGQAVRYVDAQTAADLASDLTELDADTVQARVEADTDTTATPAIPDPSINETSVPAPSDGSWFTPRGLTSNLWGVITGWLDSIGDILWPLRLVEDVVNGAE